MENQPTLEPTHTYTAPGLYIVTLDFSADGGQSFHKDQMNLVVGDAAPAVRLNHRPGP